MKKKHWLRNVATLERLKNLFPSHSNSAVRRVESTLNSCEWQGLQWSPLIRTTLRWKRPIKQQSSLPSPRWSANGRDLETKKSCSSLLHWKWSLAGFRWFVFSTEPIRRFFFRRILDSFFFCFHTECAPKTRSIVYRRRLIEWSSTYSPQ